MTSAAEGSTEITVVIATHNRRGWLEPCVDSVCAQQGVSLEIVIVDDASSDGTADWLRTVHDSRVRVIHLPTPSERSAARNIGLAKARGHYVMFLDDDDWLTPNALRVLKDGLAGHPGAVAVVGARWSWFTAENYQRRDSHPHVPRVRNVMEELLVGWSAVSGQNLYRTALVKQVGGYDPSLSLCEDRDLWLRLAALGRVVLRPEVVVTYRVHPQQTRPPTVRQIRDRVARRAIKALARPKRRHALRLRRTTWHLDCAEDAFATGRVSSGVVHALRAFANTPAIFASPLIGPWVARRLAGRIARRFL